MHWRIECVDGLMGATTPNACLREQSRALGLPNEQGQYPILDGLDGDVPEDLLARVLPWLQQTGPQWLVLPPGQLPHWQWWQAQLKDQAEVVWGRAGVTLSLSQMDRLGEPARVVAVAPAQGTLGVESLVSLDWSPSEGGFRFLNHGVEGRPGSEPDVSVLIEKARTLAPELDMLLMSTGEDDPGMKLLQNHFGSMDQWVLARWMFPEQSAAGPMSTAGSLFYWAWLADAYRYQDCEGPAAVFALDECSLAGLSVVEWTD